MDPYINLPKVPVVRGRQDMVVERCRGKRVLHLGCVDAGLLEQRYQKGELMHQRLAVVAHELWGVDLDAQGIQRLRELGFANLVVGDVCELHGVNELDGRTFEVIVASEVVEHLLNPGQFLDAVRRFMTPGETELVVTVPNAFRFDTLRWLLRGVEYVHPDHNYWFSYHTIVNLLRKTGFASKEVYVYSFSALEKPVAAQAPSTDDLPRRARLRSAARRATGLLLRVAKDPLAYMRQLARRIMISWLYRRTPFWGDGLIIVSIVRPTETGWP